MIYYILLNNLGDQMGTPGRVSKNIKIIKKQSKLTSGLLSKTEFKPVIMPGEYLKPDLTNVISKEKYSEIIKKVYKPVTFNGGEIRYFWDSPNAYSLKYSDTGRKLSMLLEKKTYNKNLSEGDELIFAEFETPEYATEGLFPKNTPTETSYYFKLLSTNYATVKNGDIEIIPVFLKGELYEGSDQPFFLSQNPTTKETYYILPKEPIAINYLYKKFPTRKLKFVANSLQIEQNLRLKNLKDKKSLRTNIGILDAQTNELIAITKGKAMKKIEPNGVDNTMINILNKKLQ